MQTQIEILNSVAGKDANLLKWLTTGDVENKLLFLIQAGIDEGREESKNESVLFAEWCQEEGWDKLYYESIWKNRMGYDTEYTTEQLYIQFQESKNHNTK